MKKIFTFMLAVLMTGTVAASEYQFSVGMVAGLGLGAQFKVNLRPHFVLMDEFGFFTCLNGGTGSYGGAVDNLVLAWQDKCAEGEGIELSYYAGGQVKGGYDAFSGGGVFGFGAAGGIEANIKQAPIAFSFDFRPGYALTAATVFTGFGTATTVVNHLFDWSFNLGIRYTFPLAKAAQPKKK